MTSLTQRRFVANVFEQNVQRLQQLDAYEAGTTAFLSHNV